MKVITRTVLGCAGMTLTLLLVSGVALADLRHVHKATKPVTVTPPPAPVIPMPAVIPPERLDLRPAVPPQVSYSNGQLTITAQNSTLGDVLNSVHAKTGTVIEVSGPATDRIAIRIGPAPVREVLTALLDGSRFNYIILGSSANPLGAEHVILTPKTGGAATGPVASSQPVYQPPPQPQAPPPGAFVPGQFPGVVRGPGGLPVPGQPGNPGSPALAETAPEASQEAEQPEPEAEADQNAAPEADQPDPEPDPSPGEADQNQHQRGPDGTPPPDQPQGPK